MRAESIIAERFLALLSVVVLVSICILAFPYVRSASGLHQGKRALDGALRKLGVKSTDWNDLVSHPINPNVGGFTHEVGIAADYLQQAVAAAPGNAEAYRGVRTTYFTLGDASTALEALTSVSEVGPHDLATCLAMGDIYDGLGMTEEAVAEYDRGRYGPSIERAIVNYLKLAEWRLKAGDPPRGYALLSSLWLALSFWHINFTRIGYQGILLPLLFSLSLHSMRRSWNLPPQGNACFLTFAWSRVSLGANP